MEASFWRRLWTCCHTECWMNEWIPGLLAPLWEIQIYTKVFFEIAGFWAWDRFLDSWIRRVRSVEIVSCQDYMMLRWQMNDIECCSTCGIYWQGKTTAVRIIISCATSLSVTNPKECELFHFDSQYNMLLRFMNKWPYSWNSVYF